MRGIGKSFYVNRLFSLMLCFTLCFCSFATLTQAQGLDGLGGTTQDQPQVDEQQATGGLDNSSSGGYIDGAKDYKSSVDSLLELNKEVGASGEDYVKVSRQMSGLSKVVNYAIAGIFFVVLLLSAGVSAIDIAYLSLPFTRKFLNPEYGAVQQQSGSMMGGMAQPQQAVPRKGTVWVSDEAKSVLDELTAPAQATGGMMGGGMMGGSMMGMGGGFGGGFGGGMMGASQQQEPPTRKIILVTYLKRRTIMLVLLGVSIAVFSTTMFTDLGIQLSSFVLSKIFN